MEQRPDNYLLTRLIIGMMLFLAADIAFTRHRDAILGAKFEILTDKIEESDK